MISGIGELELMLIAVVTLLVIGPERLPETLRTLGLWIGRLSRSFSSVKAEIEKEIGMDEVRQQLHNEAVMAEMQRIESEVKAATQLDGSKTDERYSMSSPDVLKSAALKRRPREVNNAVLLSFQKEPL